MCRAQAVDLFPSPAELGGAIIDDQGMPEKRTRDHVRHGTTSLLAAFNTADGTVISSTHRQHRTIEFKKFLTKIDGQVPVELDVHLICDNYATHKTPAIKAWLAAHPRFHIHFTPTGSSWINQVERWFAYLTDVLLRRSDHRSVQVLEKGIRAWVSAWNDNPKPFVWTKTAEQILDSLRRLAKRINRADTNSAAHNNAAPSPVASHAAPYSAIPVAPAPCRANCRSRRASPSAR